MESMEELKEDNSEDAKEASTHMEEDHMDEAEEGTTFQ